jgi:hypothetical protein
MPEDGDVLVGQLLCQRGAEGVLGFQDIVGFA